MTVAPRSPSYGRTLVLLRGAHGRSGPRRMSSRIAAQSRDQVTHANASDPPSASDRHRPRVLLFASTTGYQVREFANAAERLGIELIFATDRCHVLQDPWGDAAIPLRFADTSSGLDSPSKSRIRPADSSMASSPSAIGPA